MNEHLNTMNDGMGLAGIRPLVDTEQVSLRETARWPMATPRLTPGGRVLAVNPNPMVATYVPVTTADIVVTEEMISAIDEDVARYIDPDDAPRIYRAMRAHEPLNAAEKLMATNQMAAMGRLAEERDQARKYEAYNAARTVMIERALLRSEGMRDELEKHVKELEARLSKIEEDAIPDHPYTGPRKDGVAVPDVVHERFHKAIGDVLDGNVMPKAREQMRDALGKAPEEKKPFPGKALGLSHQQIGIRLP